MQQSCQAKKISELQFQERVFGSKTRLFADNFGTVNWFGRKFSIQCSAFFTNIVFILKNEKI
jgi:hypothetical protein